MTHMKMLHAVAVSVVDFTTFCCSVPLITTELRFALLRWPNIHLEPSKWQHGLELGRWNFVRAHTPRQKWMMMISTTVPLAERRCRNVRLEHITEPAMSFKLGTGMEQSNLRMSKCEIFRNETTQWNIYLHMQTHWVPEALIRGEQHEHDHNLIWGTVKKRKKNRLEMAFVTYSAQ